MSSKELSGRVSLVTGASRGIGRAIAIGLADRGSDVLLAARNVVDLEAVARECEGRGVRARPLTIDLASAESIAA